MHFKSQFNWAINKLHVDKVIKLHLIIFFFFVLTKTAHKDLRLNHNNFPIKLEFLKILCPCKFYTVKLFAKRIRRKKKTTIDTKECWKVAVFLLQRSTEMKQLTKIQSQRVQ